MSEKTTENNKLELRYFDRINDKLLTCNLFFLAGYLSLIAIEKLYIFMGLMIFPIIAINYLIRIDHLMMKRFSNKENNNAKDKNEIQIYSLTKTAKILTLISTFGFVVICCHII